MWVGVYECILGFVILYFNLVVGFVGFGFFLDRRVLEVGGVNGGFYEL